MKSQLIRLFYEIQFHIYPVSHLTRVMAAARMRRQFAE
jgi:hypothetical protein